MEFRRFAVYYTPPDGPLARFGARWLGWDIATGRAVEQPAPPGLPAPLPEITAAPRRYGFHATVKPPFRLAAGHTAAALAEALERFCVRTPGVTLDGLAPAPLGRFLALLPEGDPAPLNALAATVVEGLDDFRAPLSGDELARRRGTGLTPRHEALLARWGYPYVMDAFRFHMTLTGKLPPDSLAAVRAVVDRDLGPLLPRPFTIDGLSLVGEAGDGRFHLIHRYPLSI